MYGGIHTLSLINTYDFDGHRLGNNGQDSDCIANVGKLPFGGDRLKNVV